MNQHIPSTTLVMILLLCLPVVSLTAAVPRPEHPRPDFRRDDWANLNGAWLFDFDENNTGETDRWFADAQHEYSKKITVPFPWESKLSGIQDTEYEGTAWYQRQITIPEEWADRRVFLCFGAIDWSAKVWIDDTLLGEHHGGYSQFDFEITNVANPGEPARLTVRAHDTTDPEQPAGKQKGHWYTTTSGIWQTVWMEARGQAYIRQAHFTPDIDKELATANIAIETDEARDLEVVIETDPAEENSPGFETVVRPAQVIEGETTHAVTVPIPSPELWSPESPKLYYTRVSLRSNGEIIDSVRCYFGMRKISVEKAPGRDYNYICLNGRPVYLRGALDQSFHPEGLYTFPSDDVIRQDILRTRQYGLNFLRIHIKVDEPRLYYWADRLGVLMMCDIPCFRKYTEAARTRWLNTLKNNIARDYNHPSIFSWCLFNETWGLPLNQKDCQDWVRRMYYVTRELDPTRLVEDNSPCRRDHVITDINSWHFYINNYNRAANHIEQVVSDIYPGSDFNYIGGNTQGNAPLMNSEYGGISAGAGDKDISWCFKYLTNELRKYPKTCGYVYTELQDIEFEHNGFMNYDRRPKAFGYGDISAGVTLRDLNNPDFVVIDFPPCPTFEPGAPIEVPILFSHYSNEELTDPVTVKWRLDGVDRNGRNHRSVLEGEFEVQPKHYDVVPVGTISAHLPDEQMLGTLSCWVEDFDERVIARNYVNIDIFETPTPRVECPGPRELHLRWRPENVADTSWTLPFHNRPSIAKMTGIQKGFVEYHIKFPEGLDPSTISTIEFRAELASCARGGKSEWRVRPTDFPQTDTTIWPSDVTLTIFDEEVAKFRLEDEPADARGILSHKMNFQPGTYGRLINIQLTREQVLAAIRKLREEPVLKLRLDAQGVRKKIPAAEGIKAVDKQTGGLSVFCERTGRYPMDPCLIVHTQQDFDREKLEEASTAAVNIISVSQEPIVSTADRRPEDWKYTTSEPGPDWRKLNFDDQPWKTGRAGFGTSSTPDTTVNTTWNSSDIWIRKVFKLDRLPDNVMLRLYHDEDCEVFINEKLVLRRKGHIVNYRKWVLNEEDRTALKVGDNVMAIHCRQTSGGQYIDAGLYGTTNRDTNE